VAMRQTLTEQRSIAVAKRLTETEEFKDFPEFAAKYLRILNRSDTSGREVAGYVNLVLNAVQLDFYKKIMAAREAGRPGRFIVLKARRMGLSTASQAFMFHQCLTQRERRAFITAADDGTTNNIFLMAKSMLEQLPRAPSGPKGGVPAFDDEELGNQWRAADLRPEHRRNNDNQLWLTHPKNENSGLNSRFDVACAKSVKSSRGFELHYFHGSEIGFWENAGEFMVGLMPTFSETPDSLIVLESTANGAGGYFHDKFWRHWKGPGAKKKKEGAKDFDDGEEAWESVFYGWWQMPFYKRPLPEGVTARELLDSMPDEILKMIQDYDLSPEQAYWAYRTWKDKMEEDWDLFRQEYPGNPQEAFAFAASRVFAEPDLRAIEAQSVRAPYFQGDIIDADDRESIHADAARVKPSIEMRPELVPDADGPLWCWEKPADGKRYILFMDVASGKATGDYTAIQVIDQDSRLQVAEFCGQVDPATGSRALVLLGMHYNNGMICWETNGPGHYVSLAVNLSGYWNVYIRDHVETVAMDQRIGWVTNISTKPLMISTGETLIRLKLPIIQSKRLVAELRMFLQFVKKATSTGGIISGDENYKLLRTGAPVGEHDDLVIAWTGAQTVLSMETGSRPEEVLHTADIPAQSQGWESGPRNLNSVKWERQDDYEYDDDAPRFDSVGGGWL
jgi:hypothetical protein